jgi:hypothetical protein
MKKRLIYFIVFIVLGSCKPSTLPLTNVLKRNYHLSNDSLEQSLELFSTGDSTTQFVLRVENKYQDTLDSYMSHAFSSDGKHFIHSRENCKIEFEIIGTTQDTTLLTQCNCPELTVLPIKHTMTTDSSQIIVFR